MKYYIITFFCFFALITQTAHAPSIERSEYGHSTNDYAFKQTSRKNIELASFWIIPPDIVICDRVATIQRVQKAVNFWTRLGYEFGTITKNNDAISCRGKEEYGKIRIMLPDNSRDMSNELAITLTDRLVTTNEAVSADIIIHSFAVGKELVLEHELGHALGWQHINKPGHLMYPEYTRVGHGTMYIDYVEYVKIMHKKFITE